MPALAGTKLLSNLEQLRLGLADERILRAEAKAFSHLQSLTVDTWTPAEIYEINDVLPNARTAEDDE